MVVRSGMICPRVALAIALATCGPLTAYAQFGSGGPPPYTPADDAKGLKAVLFNWTWHMGMLRGLDEHELIVSLEYQGKGTIQVDGQACKTTKYRESINYQLSGERIQYACALPNGRSVSNIEVVNWQYAWDEDIPGAEIDPGRGTAKPVPGAVQERLIRLWASPQGTPKAALAGAGNPDPRDLPDGKPMVGMTSVKWEGGKPVVTFPVPGVPGATATATLNSNYMAESVVVKHGSTTTEFTYSDYQDWNSPLNKVEVYYAGKMTERRNGKVVRDLNTVQTETGNVYVAMPVPASVRKAITPAVAGGPPSPVPSMREEAFSAEARSQPTPRTADGKPDMTGNWGAGGMNWRYGNRRCGPTQASDCSPAWNQTTDFEFESPSRYGPNRPLYKPEFWDKIQALDMWTNKDDPVMTCQPLGLPRQGPPRRIIQSADDIVFFYGQYADGGGGYGEYRIMPIDGRKHDPRMDITTTYMGHTVGHWEGDTLVLDSVGFNDQTWLGRGGYFHTDEMHIVEKFTRRGDEILYEVTVEDPDLVEPWVMTPRILKLSSNPDAGLLPERGNCETYETQDITSQIRH
jgi:hypothetical protein